MMSFMKRAADDLEVMACAQNIGWVSHFIFTGS